MSLHTVNTTVPMLYIFMKIQSSNVEIRAECATHITNLVSIPAALQHADLCKSITS